MKQLDCGVLLQTWGTTHKGGNGLLYFFDAKLFGGSFGHASLTLTIPDDEIGKELIKKYCVSEDGEQIIPYAKKQNTLTKQGLYEIRFSWYPSISENSPYLESDENNDRLGGYKGVDFRWGNQYDDIFKPSKRLHKGLLSDKLIKMGPLSIVHHRELEYEDYSVINKKAENVRFIQQIESLKLLNKKILNKIEKNDKKKYILDKSEKLLIQNSLGKFSKKFLVKNMINSEDYEKIIIKLKNKINVLQVQFDRNAKYIKECESIPGFDPDIYKDYLSLYNNESNSVHLPIKKLSKQSRGFNNGLDPVAMLKQMHRLATQENFNLFTKNCSDTIGSILEAGVQEPHLKMIAANRAFGAFGNPQMVYNSALIIQDHIYKDKKTTVWDRIKNFTPIKIIIGGLLKTFVDKKASKGKKIFAAIGLAIILPFALVSAVFRSLFNPIGAIETASTIMEYAFSRESVFLKLFATMVCCPVFIIFGIPAVIQHTVPIAVDFMFINPFKKIFSWLEGGGKKDSKITAMSSSNIHKLVNERVKEIDNKNPLQAIKEFVDLLNRSDAIPVFSAKTRIKIMSLVVKDNTLPENFIDLADRLQIKLKKYSLLEFVDEIQLLSLKRVNSVSRQLGATTDAPSVIKEKKGRMNFKRRKIGNQYKDVSDKNIGKKPRSGNKPVKQ